MRSRDWMAVGLVGVVLYLVYRARQHAAPALTLQVRSGGDLVGYVDDTDQTQYDPATGALWMMHGTSQVYIGSTDPGLGPDVFTRPDVRALIAHNQQG